MSQGVLWEGQNSAKTCYAHAFRRVEIADVTDAIQVGTMLLDIDILFGSNYGACAKVFDRPISSAWKRCASDIQNGWNIRFGKKAPVFFYDEIFIPTS